MAKDKKAFILYADQKEIFQELPDDYAGKLIKHIFQYVNDENPVTDDLILKIAFSSIKAQLKRDLKKYEEKSAIRSEAGRLGGIASGEARRSKPKQNEANGSNAKQNEQDIVIDTVIDKDIVKEKDIKNNKRRFTPPTPDQVIEYCKERENGVDPNRWFNYYTANGWKVGKNPMKDWKASVRTWEQTKSETWDVKKEDQSNFENL